MPYTSLTTRAPRPSWSFPHYLLNRHQSFGGTYSLYHQGRRMFAAVYLKILIPNYQTARNHTLEHLNLHKVPKIGDIKMRNDVNNQQYATTFSFINLFNSALHVSDDKFAHPQEHFLTVYTAFGTVHRHCCR